jgi:hypothetical protein
MDGKCKITDFKGHTDRLVLEEIKDSMLAMNNKVKLGYLSKYSC